MSSVRNRETPDTRQCQETKVVRDVLCRVRERYHGPSYYGHTIGALRRVNEITRAMGLSLRERQLARLAVAGHHLECDYGWVKGPQGRERIVKLEESARASSLGLSLLINMSMAVTGEELELVREAVMVTAADIDDMFETVVQDKLKPDSHPVVRAVALADLGAAGMDGPRVFRREACAFLEDRYPDLYRQKQDRVLRRWLTLCTHYVCGRQLFLDRELIGLPVLARDAVRSLFSQFYTTYRYLERVREQGMLRDWFV